MTPAVSTSAQAGATASYDNYPAHEYVQTERKNKRPRVISACIRCRNQKLKCDGKEPCARCNRLQVQCKHVNPMLVSSTIIREDQGQEEDSLHKALLRITQLEANVRDIQQQLADQGTWQESSQHSTPLHLHQRHPPQQQQIHGHQAAADHNTGSSRNIGSSQNTSFPAPFSEVAFDKTSLENRQVTRANSPTIMLEATLMPSSSRLSITTETWDPIACGVIDEDRCQSLLDFFMSHCYSYLPFFESQSKVSINQLLERDTFLLCTMLAIASRYAESHSQPQSQASKKESEDLCQLTERHLGATLVKSRHRLGDVQAVIMLHAWSLRSGEKGADAWILSGHAFRLAKRLSIDKRMNQGKEEEMNFAAARRTWLLLCASDCFPSLGFGRPASPRENLESCTDLVKSLTNLFAVEKVDIGCEAFIACQVQLASISRQLLDWVQEAAASTSGSLQAPSTVWDRYSLLQQQLDDCERNWGTPRLGPMEQRRASQLYRLHVKLCLATFALRLCESTNDHLSHASPISSQNHQSFRQACLDATYTMILVQGEEPCLTFQPDYLITALAQAVITFLSLLEEEDEDGYYRRRAKRLINLALHTLSCFEGSRTGLATFLSSKIRERVDRYETLLSNETNGSQDSRSDILPYSQDHRHLSQWPGFKNNHLPMQLDHVESSLVLDHQGSVQWADPDPQWGDFSQWWDHDDPLRLLFGSGADALN